MADRQRNMKSAETPGWHALMRYLAYVLVVLAFVYIGRSIWAYRDGLLGWQATSVDLALIVLSIGVYGLAGLLLSSAWCCLNRLCGQGEHPGRRHARQCMVIYGTTQIAKYVPGNVFHFVGRHAAAVQAGVPHAVLACSATLEMIALLFSAGLLALFGLLIPDTGLLGLLPFPLWMVIAIVLGGFVVMVFMAPYLIRRLKLPTREQSEHAHILRLISVALIHLLFFTISGLLMAAMMYAVVGSLDGRMLILALSAYPLSWLAGYIIPGASAGIGVREAAMMLMLSTTVLPEQATLIAILMRVVTLLGDLFFYGLVKWMEVDLRRK